MKKSISLIISITVLVLAVIFTLQNAGVIQVKILFWSLEASLSLILILTFAIGAISALVVILPIIFTLTKTKNKLMKENDALIKQEKRIDDKEPLGQSPIVIQK